MQDVAEKPILRTSPYHYELNLAELIWALVKGFAARQQDIQNERLLFDQVIKDTREKTRKCGIFIFITTRRYDRSSDHEEYLVFFLITLLYDVLLVSFLILNMNIPYTAR